MESLFYNQSLSLLSSDPKFIICNPSVSAFWMLGDSILRMQDTSESDIDPFFHFEGRKVAQHMKKMCLIWIPFMWIDKRKAFVLEAFVSFGGWGPCFRNPLLLLTSERELVGGVRKDLKQVFEKETIKSHLKREWDKRTGYSWKRRLYSKDSWARKKQAIKFIAIEKTMFWTVTLQDQARIRWDLYFFGSPKVTDGQHP